MLISGRNGLRLWRTAGEYWCAAEPARERGVERLCQSASRTLPKDRHIDSTLGLLTDGYEFICKRSRALGNVDQLRRVADIGPALPAAAAGCPAKMRRLK